MRTLALTSLSVVIALVLTELGLRASLDYLPLSLANYLGSGYTTVGDGIYRFDPAWNMPRMRSHYRRQMFFDGYRWEHQGDWMGYRNPVDRTQADIVLIGDSMIYGHGLPEAQTLRSHLEKRLNRPVANLGQQGAAIDYEYEIFKRDALRLHPQYIFVFFLNNDITDLTTRLSNSEMRRLLELPVEDQTTTYFNIKRVHRAGRRSPADLYAVKAWSFLFNIIKLDLRKWREAHQDWHASGIDISSRAASPASAGNRLEYHVGAVLPDDTQGNWADKAPFAGDLRLQLAMEFHLRMLLKMKNLAESDGVKFAYVFISVPEPYDKLYESIIANYCRNHGIDFFSLRPDLEKAAHAGVNLYLAGDGHFTDKGTLITAEALIRNFHLQAVAETRQDPLSSIRP